jgi:hypothetical protein
MAAAEHGHVNVVQTLLELGARCPQWEVTEWRAYKDVNTGRFYWWHTVTKETQWDIPAKIVEQGNVDAYTQEVRCAFFGHKFTLDWFPRLLA